MEEDITTDMEDFESSDGFILPSPQRHDTKAKSLGNMRVLPSMLMNIIIGGACLHHMAKTLEGLMKTI